MTDPTAPGYFAAGEAPRTGGVVFDNLDDAVAYARKVRAALYEQKRLAFASADEMWRNVMPNQRKVGEVGELLTVEQWQQAVEAGLIAPLNGSGSFVKDGEYVTGEIFDNVFGVIPPGVTHIEWYSK